jgi:surfactin synthase thioesterase subunit
MQRSRKSRLSEREWESAHGLEKQINNNARQDSYQAYELFCESVGCVPASEVLYDLSVSRVRK